MSKSRFFIPLPQAGWTCVNGCKTLVFAPGPTVEIMSETSQSMVRPADWQMARP